jgi:hypothetical protein
VKIPFFIFLNGKWNGERETIEKNAENEKEAKRKNARTLCLEQAQQIKLS